MDKGKSAIESQIRMINLVKEIIEEITRDFTNLEEVYIFGSRARGNYLDTGDIDFIFVFKGIKGMNVFDRMYTISKYVKGNVDYIVLDEEEKDRIREKKLLWSRDKGFVDNKGIFIVKSIILYIQFFIQFIFFTILKKINIKLTHYTA
ncbi:nucleotidyltransferase domain-containing protein [Acidianus ambivalens]|uniref:Nucleotidyltransferase domain-containing protein n=1 Tax=Acidianus ambivalens TaxID=2283 RepID=A0A650CVU6_ACIAM|nr:nucleotidyltransferase domain-containing protein [Acidianus ambivalens]MQL56579.1 nucleotidyltransferase domain-containing protein [Acidianus ambivalens]QGR21898.1 nucleotidyltransferase domain-containing protein [Acidianus ambivalens]